MIVYFYILSLEVFFMKKNVLVTGASRGIGRAAAIELSKRGYDLIILSKNNSVLLNEVKNEIEKNGGNCIVIENVDVSVYEQCKIKVFDYLESIECIPDVLINNAGISYIGLLQDMEPEEWDEVLNTNLKSVFNMSKLVIPYMVKKKNGKIINISSVWGNVGASCEVAYSASKGGVNLFTKALAKELAPSGIQVNCIAFGAVDTEMNSFLSEEDRNVLNDEIPASRMGTVKEAGEIIANIIRQPEYLTGQIITMDGGWI